MRCVSLSYRAQRVTAKSASRTARTYWQERLAPRCLVTALPLLPLKSGTAENDVNVASGGGHGTQNNEVRTRLLDGPCDGGDHPSDQTMGGRARFSKQVDYANCATGNDLPASALELVLKVRQAVPRNQLELIMLVP
jgi:hypothetical protein